MDANEHRNRRSIRLQAFEYSSPGAYFVTIVTQGRATLFGRIIHGEMRSNAAGEMVDATWRSLPERFPGMETGNSIVMPNHFHGIVIIHADVGAALVAAREVNSPRAGIPRSAPGTNARPAPTAPSLSAIVGAFKSLVTRAYMRGVRNEGWPAFHGRLWQRNYYEHILGGEVDWLRTRRYIEANPMNWDADEENPRNKT